MSHCAARCVENRFLSSTIDARERREMSKQSNADRVLLERFMPVPVRARDDTDELAMRKHECPVCLARRSQVCLWAEVGCVRSWTTHAGRRFLVDDIDVLCRGVVGRDDAAVLRALRRR